MKPRIAAGLISLLVATSALAQIPRISLSDNPVLDKMTAEIEAISKDASLSISPGTAFEIGGKTVRVFGNDPCLDVSKNLVFYIGRQTSGGSGCVLVTPEARNVMVQRETSTGLAPEIWRVDRSEQGKVRFWTTSGTAVLLSLK